jgi:rod shape-determining protein MreD
MLPNKQTGLLGYFVTIILAMSFKILPLPVVLSNINPDWVLLALIYWTLAIPEKIGVFNAWIVGLFVDVLTGRILGQHALAYALISYACLKLHRRLRQYPVLQQSLFIFCGLLFSQMLIFWIENIKGPTAFTVAFWLPVFMGTLCWPLVYSALRFIRQLRHIG